jgi:hypothetical protein
MKISAETPLGKGSFSGQYTDANYFAPVARGKVMRMTQPVFESNGTGSNVRIRRREYVHDVPSSENFTATYLAVNPGLTSTFPWLSKIAINYEKYKFHILRFGYETEASTSTSGSIMMAFEYDVHDPSPLNKQEMMGLNGATRSPAWTPQYCEADPDVLLRQQRLVRMGSVPPTADPTLYDVASFYLATSGLPTTGTLIGELYVEYDIELYIPNVVSANEVATTQSVSVMSSGNYIVSPAPTKVGELRCLIGITNELILPRAGSYLVTVCPRYSAAANSETLTVAGSLFAQVSSGNIVTASGALVKSYSYSVVAPNVNGTVLLFSRGGTLGTITDCSVIVTYSSSDVVSNSVV